MDDLVRVTGGCNNASGSASSAHQDFYISGRLIEGLL